MSQPDKDDRTLARLMEAIRRGDGAGFEALMGRYRPLISSIVVRSINPKLRRFLEPEDVVQDVSITVYRRMGAATFRSLSDFEAYRLFLRLTVRSARRQAQPVDGHYYFAVLDSLRDAAEPDKAFSLIRCAADTSPRWELFLREGEWLPTAGPLTLVTLPIGPAEVQRIKARLMTGTRYFQIVNGEPGFMVTIRHTATSEATRRHPDLPWQPCDLLGRWRIEPKWTITQPPWLAARENG